jgi:dihydrofolate reductase
MRKMYAFNMMTVDGFFEGPNKEIDWHNVDGEFNEFAIDQLNATGILLFGRVTYELMASYWPTPDAVGDDPVVAGLMNAIPKIVFSKTLAKVEWNNTRLVKENAADEIRSLKQQPGNDIAIFGSANLIASLADSMVIDEYRIIINPIVLRQGHPLFRGTRDKIKLTLLKARPFASGNVLLKYGIDRKVG